MKKVDVINRALYKTDPVGTCCNQMEEMEDEYLTLAKIIAENWNQEYGMKTSEFFGFITDYFGLDIQDIDEDAADEALQIITGKLK